MRLIDADVLKQHIDKLPALPDGNFAGNHSALKALINMQPTIESSTNCSEIQNSSDCISRQAATTMPVMPKEHRHYQTNNLDDAYEQGWNDLQECIEKLPPVQPKGTKLSTVCLLCKKPAVTFNTDDDIPYTNYSYCEDCLRKGLKLLKKQINALPTVQPNHNAEVSKMEIIHCKDCKYWKEKPLYTYCEKMYRMGILDVLDYATEENDFCSMAEKRGEADDEVGS